MDDRWAISDLVNRYFFAVDRRDWVRLRSCFTEDVAAVYESVPVAGGRDRLMAYLTGRSEIGYPLDIVDLQRSMHVLGNHVADVSGDSAVAETYALAHLVDAPPSGPRLRTRGLRYLDELVRLPDGQWRIRRREHILEWMRLDHLVQSSGRG